MCVFFCQANSELWENYWKQLEPPDSEILKGILAKRNSLAEQAGVKVLIEPQRYLKMVRAFAAEFGQHPDKVWQSTEFDTITNLSVDATRTGYYSDIYNYIENPPHETPKQE